MNYFEFILWIVFGVACFFYYREQAKKKKPTTKDYLKSASKKGERP